MNQKASGAHPSDSAAYPGLREFACTPYAPVPSIPEQIAERLGGWIKSHSTPVSLPPERTLAKIMLVNRLTLRKALARLAAAGLIVRGKRGSVSTPGGGGFRPEVRSRPDQPHPELHPLQAHTMSLQFRLKPLTLAVYETFPCHVRFWKRFEESFNRLSSSRRLELIWIPSSVSNRESYADFIRDKQVSLALAGQGMVPWLAAEKLLRPMPRRIMDALWTSEYLVKAVSEYDDSFAPYAAPVHMSSPCLMWNKDMAHDPPSPESMSAEVLAGWWRRIAGDIPQHVKIFDTPYAMVIPHGIPSARMDGAVLRKAANAIFETARFLAPCSEKIGINRSYITQGMAGFRSGMTACISTQFFMALNEVAAPSFPVGIGFFRPRHGCFTPGTATMICITAQSHDPESCAELIEFIISKEAQMMLVEELVNIPVRIDCAAALADRLGLSRNAVDNWGGNLRFFSGEQAISDIFLLWKMPLLADAVLRGRQVDGALYEEVLRECRNIRKEHMGTGK